MKKLIYKIAILGIVLAYTGCASFMPSAEALEHDPICKAWKDSAFGLKNVATIKDELADYEHDCHWLWGCSHVYAKYKEQGDIYTSNSGVLTLETKLGNYDGKLFSVDSSIVKTKPFPLGADRATYMTETFGATQDMTVHYNKACNQRQAALGVAVLFSK